MSFANSLLRATKAVHECLENSAAGAPREARWIVAGLRESCTALGDLLIDPDLLRYFRSRDEVVDLNEGRRRIAEMRDNREALEQFLSAERELCSRAGLPVSATEHLIQRIRVVILEKREANIGAVVEELASLRDYVCSGFDRSATRRSHALLAGMRDVFGGLTIATLNGGLLAVSVGISGALSAASIAAGGAVAADGYGSVRKLF